MTIHVTSERQVMQEAAQVLMRHMSPAKATRFWASWQVGEGDYLVVRDQIFAKETVKSLYKQIDEFQRKKSKK
jgi:N-dimethylarginine dimethylaminohydrolase